LNYELNPDDFVDTNTDNIVLVNELPEFGADNLLYKLPDQTFYFWNRKLNAFAPLIPEISYPEIPENPSEPNPPVIEVKGGIQVVATVEDLPEIGESDMLYKVLENELVYTWNNSTSSYKVINSATASASSIVVVENFSNLPENGENDVLYKTNATQLLYMWNNLNKTYEQLGQGNSGPVAPEGYTITL
jgi:hypothetical protein